MKGYDSFIKGYAEGGPVNPFEAFVAPKGNIFGTIPRTSRPTFTPYNPNQQLYGGPAELPSGYRSIYGNLSRIREEQARRRAAATPTPAPQPDQPSQGAEPAPAPPSPNQSPAQRELDVYNQEAAAREAAAREAAAREAQDLLNQRPIDTTPILDAQLPDDMEDFPLVTDDTPDEAVPETTPPDSSPAPLSDDEITREYLGPPNPLDPVVDEVLRPTPELVPGDVTMVGPDETELPVESPEVEAGPVFDPGESPAMSPEDLGLPGFSPEEPAPQITNPLQEAVTPNIPEVPAAAVPDVVEAPDLRDFESGIVAEAPAEEVVTQAPAAEEPVAPEEVQAANPFEDVFASPVFDPDFGIGSEEIPSAAPPAEAETPAYDLGDVLSSYSDDAYATPEVGLDLADIPDTTMEGAAKNEALSGKAQGATLGDLAKSALQGVGMMSPLGLANFLGGMAVSSYQNEEAPPKSLTGMALEKVAPSFTGISPAAKQELQTRGEIAGTQMAEQVNAGQISPTAAATALTQDQNLIGSLGPALAALERSIGTMKGGDEEGDALSAPEAEPESPAVDFGTPEIETGTPATPDLSGFDSGSDNSAPGTDSGVPGSDVGVPGGFDGGFGAGFDSGYDGGYSGGGYDGGDSGGGSGSDSGGGSDGGGGGESDAGGGGSDGGWAKGGYVPGDSGGMDDDVPAVIDGKAPARLSSGEFVFDAATVAALGDGNNEAGAKKLNMLREAIRHKAYGHKKQPPKNYSIGDLVRLYDRMR